MGMKFKEKLEKEKMKAKVTTNIGSKIGMDLNQNPDAAAVIKTLTEIIDDLKSKLPDDFGDDVSVSFTHRKRMMELEYNSSSLRAFIFTNPDDTFNRILEEFMTEIVFKIVCHEFVKDFLSKDEKDDFDGIKLLDEFDEKYGFHKWLEEYNATVDNVWEKEEEEAEES